MTKKKESKICVCCQHPYIEKNKSSQYCLNCGRYIARATTKVYNRYRSKLYYLEKKYIKKYGKKK